MAKSSNPLMQVITLLLIIPAMVTVVVGIDFLLDGFGIDLIEINLRERLGEARQSHGCLPWQISIARHKNNRQIRM